MQITDYAARAQRKLSLNSRLHGDVSNICVNIERTISNWQLINAFLCGLACKNKAGSITALNSLYFYFQVQKLANLSANYWAYPVLICLVLQLP